MKLWVAVTDYEWFSYLAGIQPDEVNFWQPSGSRDFRVLNEGEPFLFKLHSPRNFIVGGGFFIRSSLLPCSRAWEAFGNKNGVVDFASFLESIHKYRSKNNAERVPDPVIGCNILTEPIFFSERDWLPVPKDFAKNIVQGKTYDTNVAVGRELWEQFIAVAGKSLYPEQKEDSPRYGEPHLARGRLGQGAFRIMVTDAYHRRCAITGERTLPVLEAAHIKPFSKEGPNNIENGLLLRSDLHKLFDLGFVTVTPDLHIEVSKKIKEEYENGREYYAYHGNMLREIPDYQQERPNTSYLQWHNEQVFVP